MRQRQKALAKQTEALTQGERLLVRQRYQFGDGWPQTSMVEAAYADFETILGRRCVSRTVCRVACHRCFVGSHRAFYVASQPNASCCQASAQGGMLSCFGARRHVLTLRRNASCYQASAQGVMLSCFDARRHVAMLPRAVRLCCVVRHLITFSAFMMLSTIDSSSRFDCPVCHAASR